MALIKCKICSLHTMSIVACNSPGGVGDVNGGTLTNELGKVMSTDAAGTGATQTLHASNNVHVGILPVGKLEGQLDVSDIAGDTGILLVHAGVIEHPTFGLLDTGEDPGLARRVAVGTDANVDLFGILARLEGLGDAEDSIRRSHGNVGEVLAGRADAFGCGGGEGGGR